MEKVKKYIEQGDTAKALDYLQTILSPQHQAEITALKSRLNRIESEERKGIIKNEDYKVELNRINRTALKLLGIPSEEHDDKPIYLQRNVILGLVVGGIILVVIFLVNTNSQIDNSNNKGVIIHGDMDGSEISMNHYGDTTTSASKRYENALVMVRKEVDGNFLNLSTLINSFENHPPEAFWDKRRPNETETAFQDRAKVFHGNYSEEIEQIVRKFPITTEIYNSYLRELSYNSEIASKLKDTYAFQQEAKNSITDFIEHITPSSNYSLADSEITNRNKSLHEEKLINAKIALCQAAAKNILTLESPHEIAIFKTNFELSGLTWTQKKPKEIWQELNGLMASLYQKKSEAIRGQIINKSESEQREIDRLIKDPYLLKLREMMGMKSELSEGELWALKNKKINTEETNPEELLTLSALSFIESDGRASEYYLDKSLKTPELSELQEQFISLSLARVRNPDMYEGSIGVMIFDIKKEGTADGVGLKQGDVIFKVNGITINEPLDISSTLGKIDSNNDVLLDLKREKRHMSIAIQGGQSLNCKGTQLIILNAVQI